MFVSILLRHPAVTQPAQRLKSHISDDTNFLSRNEHRGRLEAGGGRGNKLAARVVFEKKCRGEKKKRDERRGVNERARTHQREARKYKRGKGKWKTKMEQRDEEGVT